MRRGGSLTEIALSSGGQHAEDVILGCHAGHRRDQVLRQVEVRQHELVFARVHRRAAASAPARHDRQFLQGRRIVDRSGDDRMSALVDGDSPQLFA